MSADSPSARCPDCGGVMPLQPGMKCPACLLRGALLPPGGDDETVKSPNAKFWAAPELTELAPLFPSMELLELLGRGGMGAVYKARQKSLDRFVAIKVLPPEGMENPEFGERFLREAQALAGLSHPNIVGLHDFGRTVRGHWYFIMEFVDGLDLARMMRGEKLKPAAALALIPQICDALTCAHEAGFIHRDIKPANILVDKKGRVKVADFGLAKLAHPRTGDYTLTGEGAVLGTPRYMAPEQLEHPLEVDHRADIYALGVVFYEMLTGEVPQGRFQPPSERAAVDPRLDEVVLRAMDREPSRRFQHVSEIKSGIEQAVRPRGKVYRWRWPLGAAASVAAGMAVWILWPPPPSGTAPPPVRFRENSLGQKFVAVPGTEVNFAIWETRVQEWEAFCQATGRQPAGAPFAQGADHPVVRVSAEDAAAFCEWLTKRERRDGKLAADEFYRLPTDAEWSTAAGLPPETGSTPEEKHSHRRGMYPWGDRAPAPQGAGNYPDAALRAVQDGVAVIPSYYDGFARTAPAGSFPPNTSNLFDMGGNVWELTGTPFSDKLKNPSARGGSWWPLDHDETWSGLLSSYRRSDLSTDSPAADCGFRIVIAKREGEHRTRDLFAACREDRSDEVRALLKAGASPLETNADDRTPLITAARHGALECIRALLDHGVNIDGEDKAGNTALHHAIRSRQTEAALLLLEKGASGRYGNAMSSTPLHTAAGEGMEQIAERLLAAGAAADAADTFGSTPLMLASQQGHSQIVERLLRHKADLRKSNQFGFTSLHMAVAESRMDAARVLSKAGAAMDASAAGLTPLDFAALFGDVAMVRTLLDLNAAPGGMTARMAALSGQPESFDLVMKKWRPTAEQMLEAKLLEAAATNPGDYLTSLFRGKFHPKIAGPMAVYLRDRMAMREGRDPLAIVRRLIAIKEVVPLASGPDPSIPVPPVPPPVLPEVPRVPADHPDLAVMSALNRAAQGGLIKVMEELLANGANPDRADDAGYTPLLSAAEHSQTEAIRLLLGRGAWVEARTKDQLTALMIAATGPAAEPVRLLLAQGADKEARDRKGHTALMAACWEGRVECARVLLEAGAAINVWIASEGEDNGAGPVHFAAAGRKYIERGREEQRKQIGAAAKPLGAEPGSDEEYLAILKLLLEHRANPDAATGGGPTPLMYAARTNHAAAVKLLLEHKATVTLPTTQGVTALHEAAQANAMVVLPLLLAAGARADPFPLLQVMTPLHYAAKEGADEAIAALLKAGANLKAVDARRATPLHWAASAKKTETVEALLAAGADIEARDFVHNTPLHMAAVAGDSETIRLLMQHGAKLSARNLDSSTPADVARFAGKKDAATLIENEIQRLSLQPQK